jgi:hypothetical protein
LALFTVVRPFQGFGARAIATTFNAAGPIAWRQCHHWNLTPGIARIKLSAGRNVLTVHILTGGQMNLATLAFKKVSK